MKNTLTCARPDIRHVNQRAWILNESLVMQRHACTEVLWIHWLTELSVGHWHSCLVFSCWHKTTEEKNVTNGLYRLTVVSMCSHMPICLMPSLSSMRSWTRGMSIWSLGPWGGPFTGVSMLRLFLLHTHRGGNDTCKHTHDHLHCALQWLAVSYLISISARLLASVRRKYLN